MALAPAAFALALLLLAITGFAIQRGATCMVVAVREILEQRTARTAFALLEAGLWVGGLLALLAAVGRLPALPPPPPSLALALVGGVILGVGAVLNRACVLGTIARLGSGEWAYAFTPLGFLAGAVAAHHALPLPPAATLPAMLPPGPGVPWPFAAALLLVAVLRLKQALGRKSLGLPLRRRWTPHAATTVIAIAFVGLLLVAGPWSWTSPLVDLARTGMTPAATPSLLLLAALASGAILGGRLLGAAPAAAFRPGDALRSVGGGALLAVGALLVPGSNDSLLLLGVPLAWGNGAAALAAMALTIAAVHRPRR